MSIDSKRKGSDFEREIVKILPDFIKGSVWKRIPSSGALGTQLGMPSLTSDLVGDVEHIQKKFKGEAKVGYGGAKQFTLKKEWIDKIIEEAEASYSIPFVIGKFSGSRDGARIFIVLDLDTFADLLNTISSQAEELDRVYDEKNQTLEEDRNSI